jgi:hypothetical protein
MGFRIACGFMLFICLAGCGSKHYYTLDDGSISLFYRNDQAEEVLFASSIDRFTVHPAIETDKDLWQVSVPLREEFAYFYIVDGTVTVPECDFKQLDDFGSENCLYVKGM